MKTYESWTPGADQASSRRNAGEAVAPPGVVQAYAVPVRGRRMDDHAAVMDMIWSGNRMVAQCYERARILAGKGVSTSAQGPGLPAALKAGIESLSGMCLDDVQVHYNSDKPAQLQAHAFAQGKDIYVASGQEHHLPHEAWHVVQQAQGRVRPTMQGIGGQAINDDEALEHEATHMGAKAMTQGGAAADAPGTLAVSNPAQCVGVAQREVTENGERLDKARLGKALRQLLETTKLSSSKRDKRLALLLSWAERLDSDRLSVDILQLFNATSYDELVKTLVHEAGALDEEVGAGAHGFQRHSAITRDQMRARLAPRVERATKFVDAEQYERLVEELRGCSKHLKHMLENLGEQIIDASPGEDPGNATIHQTTDLFFGEGIASGGFHWRLNGRPRIAQRANGYRDIEISWTVQSVNRYKKIVVEQGVDDEFVVEKATAWSGNNPVQLTVNAREGSVTVAGLDGKLRFETLY